MNSYTVVIFPFIKHDTLTQKNNLYRFKMLYHMTVRLRV